VDGGGSQRGTGGTCENEKGKGNSEGKLEGGGDLKTLRRRKEKGEEKLFPTDFQKEKERK